MLPAASRTVAVSWYVGSVMKIVSVDSWIDAGGPVEDVPVANGTVSAAATASPSRSLTAWLTTSW